MKKSLPLIVIGMTLLEISPSATAHVEYYDLNQGRQIQDLTAQGKTLSTVQYGANAAVAGMPALNGQSDRPLNDPAQWTSANQNSTTVGRFSNVVYTPTLSTATVLVNDVTDFGWGDGTHDTLGDSHKLDLFNFRLSSSATVTITWNVGDGAGNYFDSGFSLYSGVLSYQAHDDALDPLNPKTGFPPRKIQDLLDTGAVTDAQGIASAMRNTATNARPYVGQFNAEANWGEANGAGNWSNIAFIAAVNAHNPAAGFVVGNPASTRETLTLMLGPGNYTIAASGALGALGYGEVAPSFNLTGLHGELGFRAAAVPLPTALCLLGSAMAGLASVRRRRPARP